MYMPISHTHFCNPQQSTSSSYHDQLSAYSPSLLLTLFPPLLPFPLSRTLLFRLSVFLIVGLISPYCLVQSHKVTRQLSTLTYINVCSPNLYIPECVSESVQSRLHFLFPLSLLSKICPYNAFYSQLYSDLLRNTRNVTLFYLPSGL
jgi:hypothetical protein